MDREEAAAIVSLTGPDDLRAILPDVLGGVPVRDRPSILRVAMGVAAPEERTVLLVVAAPTLGGVTAADLGSVVDLLAEEDREAGRALLAGQWPVLRAVLVASEAERLSVLTTALDAHPPTLAEPEAILQRFDEPAPVLDLVLPHTPGPDRIALLTAASARETFDDDRLALLTGREEVLRAETRNLPAMARLLATYQFDTGRATALGAILNAAPEEVRPSLVRLGVEQMSFDDARLQVLDAWPREAHAMSASDRAATLNAFSFQRADAEQRLGASR